MGTLRLRSILWLAALAAIVSVAVFAMGCGGSDPSSGTSPSPDAASFDGASIAPDPSLSALLPADIRSSGVLRVASGFPYAPWEYYDPPTSKNPAGFDYDLGQAIGAKLGVKVPFVNTPWDSMILSVKGGKNDMIMADMYDTPDRQKELTFVDYAWDGTAILVLNGNPTGITDLDSLAGKTVSVVRGTSQEALLDNLNATFEDSGKDPMTILSLPGGGDEIVAVVSGKAAAVLEDHSVAQYTANTASTGAGKTFECLTNPAAPHGYEPTIVGIGIAKNNPELVTAVQKALQSLIDDGTYQKIVAKWELLPVESALVNQGGKSASPSPAL